MGTRKLRGGEWSQGPPSEPVGSGAARPPSQGLLRGARSWRAARPATLHRTRQSPRSGPAKTSPGEAFMTAIDPSLRDAMLQATPNLRAFAISLTSNVDRADDLVQETLMRAIANIDRFQPGTNMQAWLFTILRNLFHSEYRKRRREVEDADGKYAATLAIQPHQGAHLDFEDLQRALTRLPADQREALLLVGASGFSYEQAAEICGCAVGTIKSRVNRARTRLAELMHLGDMNEDLGPDRVILSVMHAVA